MSGNDDNSFLGRGWSFPPSFSSSTGRTKMADREEDIHQSLRILFSTSPGERTMRPDYGCCLRRMVFDKITETGKARMADEIRRSVLFFEPRIDLTSVQIEVADPLEGRLFIHLEYIIRSINSRSNMVFPFYYLEGSNISDPTVIESIERETS